MIIYFVNKKSKLKGPFDIGSVTISIGDVCIRDTAQGVQFLVVISNVNSWNACACAECADVKLYNMGANMLLFSFDGVKKRYGDIHQIEALAKVFSAAPLHRFMKNALDILTYRCDGWDAKLFVDINNLNAASNSVVIEKVDVTPKGNRMFIDYFDLGIKELILNLQSENLSRREIYTKIKTLKPKEFRLALKMFLTDNPNSNIYNR